MSKTQQQILADLANDIPVHVIPNGGREWQAVVDLMALQIVCTVPHHSIDEMQSVKFPKDNLRQSGDES